MSKEGYIQLKVRELEEKLEKSEEKINELIKIVDMKQLELNKILKDLNPTYEKYKNIQEREIEFINELKQVKEESKAFHKKNYKKMFKDLLKEINKNLNSVRGEINYTIADHTTHAQILIKLLGDKGIINLHECVKYVEKYHDMIRDENLKGEPPQKRLEILEDKNERTN